MTDLTGPEAPPPGWYHEAADSSEYRWWDGRDWTEHRSTAVAGGAIRQPALASGTSVGTVWIWLLSLVPLASLAGEQPVLAAYGPLLRAQLHLQREILAHPDAPPSLPSTFSNFGVLFAISWGVSLVLIGLAALVAYLDWRTLKRRGVVRPFPWGWGFLVGVYIVGRAVIVRRRIGRGMAPLWLAVGLFALAMVIQLTEFFSIFSAAGALAPTAG